MAVQTNWVSPGRPRAISMTASAQRSHLQVGPWSPLAQAITLSTMSSAPAWKHLQSWSGVHIRKPLADEFPTTARGFIENPTVRELAHTVGRCGGQPTGVGVRLARRAGVMAAPTLKKLGYALLGDQEMDLATSSRRRPGWSLCCSTKFTAMIRRWVP